LAETWGPKHKVFSQESILESKEEQNLEIKEGGWMGGG
jgi:hypothetical protein